MASTGSNLTRSFLALFLFALISSSVARRQGKNRWRNNDFCLNWSGAVCVTEGCVQAAAGVLEHMDKTVNPCDQFFQFACQNYINTVPSSQREAALLLKIFDEDSVPDFMKIIQQDTPLLNGQPSEAVTKAKQYFDACVTPTGSIDSVFQLINDLGSWTLTSNAELNTWSSGLAIEEALAKSHKIQTDLFFTIGKNKFADSVPVRLYIAHGYGMPPNQEAVSETLKVLVQTLQEGAPLSDSIVDKIVELHTEVNQLPLPADSYFDFSKHVTMSLDDLNDLLGGAFDMKKYIRELMGKDIADISVHGTEYFEKLGELFGKYEQEVIQNYIVFASLMTQKNAFPAALAAVRDTYYNQTGGTFTPLDVEGCARNTIFGMGFVSSALLFGEKVTTEDKKTVEEIAEYVKKAAADGAFQWMDRLSRMRAIEKIEKTVMNIAFPDWMTDISLLDQHYADFDTSDSLFDNRVSKNRYNVRQIIAAVGEPVTDLWIEDAMPPALPYALYHFSLIQVSVFGGILKNPVYDRRFPKAMMFGAVGGFIAQELMHGFDPRGRQVDGDGNEGDVFTARVLKKFEEKDKCLVDQYSAMDFRGNPLNGTKTLDKNFADNAGLSIAYSAYQMWKGGLRGVEKKLPGLELSTDQLFFLAHSQAYCGTYNDGGAISATKYRRSSPFQMRAEVPLMNHPAFARAYQCPRGTRMNPASKCSIV